MGKDKIIEALKSIEDVEPSENFRKNLYLKIEEKLQKKQQQMVLVPVRIFAFSTAVSLFLIIFVSFQIAAAAQSGSNIAKLSPFIERFMPFATSKIKLSNFSSIHNCINMFSECKCLMVCGKSNYDCPC